MLGCNLDLKWMVGSYFSHIKMIFGLAVTTPSIGGSLQGCKKLSVVFFFAVHMAYIWVNHGKLGGGFKYVYFSSLLGEDSHFD